MNVLIIGQGLAGTVMHFSLLQHGIQASVLDDGWVNASSTGAAGLYNPIVFKRFTMAWRGKEFHDAALPFYRQLEAHTHQCLLHEMPYAKLFGHANDQATWQDRLQKDPFRAFMRSETVTEIDHAPLKPYFGYGTVEKTGFIDLPTLLRAYRHFLAAKGLLFEEPLAYHQIDPKKPAWRGQSFDRIICCEGHRGTSNPWFHYLPLRYNQGEVLRIHAPGLNVSRIINRSIFIVPLGNDRYRVGATYNWKNHHPQPTKEGREDLEKRLQDTIAVPYTVEEHWGGIRPVTPDRRPLCGKHPQYPLLAIFNGLGTRGVLNAPLLAKELADYLFHDKPLHPEADISRFLKG